MIGYKMNTKNMIAYVLVVNKFQPITRKHNRISHGSSDKNNNYLSPDKLLIKPKHYLNHNLSGVPSFSKVSLLAMKKYNLKNTAVLLQDILNDTRYSIYRQWYFTAFDIIESND